MKGGKVFRAISGAALLGTAMICCPPSAGATPEETALNGMFSAVSDGAWAKTNESFRDEARVVATWTVSSSCTTYQDCTGTVSSDQGWTANLVFRSGKWTARHMVPRWIPCPDGTFSDAEQIFIFWPKRADAPDHRDLFIGWDTTLGPSGACGVNRNLEVRMPFTLTRIG